MFESSTTCKAAQLPCLFQTLQMCYTDKTHSRHQLLLFLQRFVQEVPTSGTKSFSMAVVRLKAAASCKQMKSMRSLCELKNEGFLEKSILYLL